MKKFYYIKYYYRNEENTIPMSTSHLIYCEEKKTNHYYKIDDVEDFYDLYCYASTLRYDAVYTDKTFPFFKDCIRTHFETITEKNFKKGQIVAEYIEDKYVTMEKAMKILNIKEFKEFMNDLKKGEN